MNFKQRVATCPRQCHGLEMFRGQVHLYQLLRVEQLVKDGAAEAFTALNECKGRSYSHINCTVPVQCRCTVLARCAEASRW